MMADTNEPCKRMGFILTVKSVDGSWKEQDVEVDAPYDITQTSIIGGRCQFGDNPTWFRILGCKKAEPVAQSTAQEVDSTP